MTQQTRNIISTAMLGGTMLTIVVFVGWRIMNPSPPDWTKDLVALGAAPLLGKCWRRSGLARPWATARSAWAQTKTLRDLFADPPRSSSGVAEATAFIQVILLYGLLDWSGTGF